MQIETLKIQSTVLPEERISQDQWEKEFLPGARLKPEVHAFASCPLSAYLDFIDNTLNSNN